MRRILGIAGVFMIFTIAVQGHDEPSRPADADAINQDFSRWVFPGSTVITQTSVLTENDRVVGIAPALGEYSTEALFHEVVRFYVDRSGFEPPNWSILGRQFPGDKINLSGFWSAQMGKGKTVTMQHNIRPDHAVVTVLVSDLDGRRTTAVTITRGLQNAQTYVQIVRHVRN